MRNITKFVNDIVNDRNEIIARLASAQNVDLTLGDYSNFKPDPKLQEQGLEANSDIDLLFDGRVNYSENSEESAYDKLFEMLEQLIIIQRRK